MQTAKTTCNNNNKTVSSTNPRGVVRASGGCSSVSPASEAAPNELLQGRKVRRHGPPFIDPKVRHAACPPFIDSLIDLFSGLARTSRGRI